MADDDAAGPSGAKRARRPNKKYNFNAENDLKELDKLLYESEDNDFSDNEELVCSSSDEEYIPETDLAHYGEDLNVENDASDSDYSDDNVLLQNTLLPNQPPITAVQAKAKAPKIAKAPLPCWTEDTSSMKTIHFTKRREFLVMPEGNRPIDFFNMLLDDHFYELVAEETNKYAEEVFLASMMLPSARITRWRPITVDELRLFFGIFLHMGTISTNRLQDYWKTSRLFSIPFFCKAMSRDRFLLIMRCLHFATNPEVGQPKPEERLFKIRPLIEYFNNKMAEVYYPDRNLSLDESMILWRGRLSFRQYIKNKRHKYGIKLYVLTEPDGTNLKFAVYTGQLDDLGGKGHAANVVLNLMEGRLDAGHSLFMDNYYNGYDLSQKLLARNTYCTGTLRADRKNIPDEIKTQKLNKGQTIYKCSEDGVLVGKWRDKREVAYITTEFTNEMINYTDKLDREKQKPLPIYQYNKFMGGVDRQDQLMSYYPCDRKSLRWYKKLGLHILQMLMLNSFLLFKKFTKSKMSIYEFRLIIIESLVPDKPMAPVRDEEKNHTPHKNPVGNNGRVLSRRCVWCYQHDKKRKETTFHCPGCKNNPYLCTGRCFKDYHANM